MELRAYFLVAIVLSIVILVLVLVFLIYKNHAFRKKSEKLLKEMESEIYLQKQETQACQIDLADIAKIKNKLFSVLSHDLRSPFATLESLMMLLEYEEYDQLRTKDFLSQVRSLSNNTLQTMENTLDWVKFNTKGAYTYQPVNIKLNVLANELIEFFFDITRSKQITIKNEIDQDTEIHADKAQVRIILRNFISNAIKFSNEGDKITLGVSKHENNMVEIFVMDSGVGIAEDKIGKLFNPLTHFASQGTKHEKGAGLGLLLSKDLIEKNNGIISIQSKPGQGTIVSVTLPLIK